MVAAGRSAHRLVVVRRAERGALEVLLLNERDAWTLPCIELPEQRSADVSELNRAVLAPNARSNGPMASGHCGSRLRTEPRSVPLLARKSVSAPAGIATIRVAASAQVITSGSRRSAITPILMSGAWPSAMLNEPNAPRMSAIGVRIGTGMSIRDASEAEKVGLVRPVRQAGPV